MTQVGRLFEQEKLEYAREEALKAAKEAAERAAKETANRTEREIAMKMLKTGKMSIEEIADCCTRLTVEDVRIIEEGLL